MKLNWEKEKSGEGEEKDVYVMGVDTYVYIIQTANVIHL